MKLFRPLLFSLILVLNTFSVHTSAQESNPTSITPFFLHTIEKGQSLYSIAAMYEVSRADIISLNPGSEEKIIAGKTLKIPQKNDLNQTQFFHTIQPKETLYQLTKKYFITAKKIIDANPGLSAENFKIGEVILIPITEAYLKAQLQLQEPPKEEPQHLDGKSKCRDMHKVKRKETVFSISRKYNITEQELIAANPEIKGGNIKKGTYLCIPYPAPSASDKKKPRKDPLDVPMNNRDLFIINKEEPQNIKNIKAAVVLPFMLDGGRKEEAARMLEYYEGLLIAVDSIRKGGVSIELFVHDTGGKEKSIQPILDKPEMKDMDIIFGPLHAEHLSPLAEFAQDHRIHLVVPFSSKVNEVFTNPTVFQVNTPQSYLYHEVYEHFVRKFPYANIIFLQAPNAKDKEDFVQGLIQELQAHNITHHQVQIDSPAESLRKVIDPNKDNIFIPTSGTQLTLSKCLPHLTMLIRENPEFKVSLFGYPEWQTYTKDHLASFYELDTYFYSSFFTNNLFPQAINFSTTYWQWYGKDMLNFVPKYGMLGFDTAYFFLKSLARFGSSFEEDINRMNISPVQTGFKLERVNNWGGFINRKVFFIRFTKDYELIKLNFD